MICCLNPACHNASYPDGTNFCSNCGVPLIVLRNRYRPLKSLAGGGFSKTYLAEDIDKLNELCVIKQFVPQAQGTAALNKATELFKQEAKRLQQLDKHPQIPTLLAYFEQDNRLYLVQEFIEGQNLLTELQQQGNFNEQKIRELLLDLLDILKTVHQYQVIHRDIKPENIIRRSDGKLVLIDFGASKQLTATVMTQLGTTIGSFGYAPLEQMQGGEAYPASDLYSVGATCFHLLSGIHPWDLWKRQGYGWVANWRQHLQQSVSKDLAQLLDKLLQEEYQQRYHSAEEVLQTLNSQQLPGTKPLTPPVPPPPWQNNSNSINIAVNLLNQGLKKYNQEDYHGAIEYYNQAIKINSKYAEAYYNRGNARSDLGDKQEAIEDYTQAIKINPDDADAYFNRGVANYEIGDIQAAIKDYTQALKINPYCERTYNNRGLANYEIGDIQAAIEDYTQALKINPYCEVTYNNRGLAHYALGDNDAAIADYTQAIKIDPYCALAYNNRGNAHYALGDNYTAITDYTQAIKIDAHFAEAYFKRGNICSDLGNNQAAIQDYNQALQINPNYADAYFNRGLAYYELGDNEAAIEDYNQVLKINQNDTHAYFNRGLASYDLGDKQAAIKDLYKSADFYKKQGNISEYQNVINCIKQLD